MSDMSSGRSVAIQGRPSFWSELLTVRGRTNRGRYWLAVLLVCLIVAPLIAIVAMTMAASGTDLRNPATLQFVPLGTLVLTFPILLASIRRLHDRDKSGHWLWLFLGVPTILNMVFEVLRQTGSGEGVAMIIGLPSLALTIWGFVEIACLRGTAGPNRFGPNPLQGASA
jgi:uncharacterized membrane protein YhaH (DUF805 family)